MLVPADIDALAKYFRPGGTFCAQLPPWSGTAAIIREIRPAHARPIIIVTDGPLTMDRIASDLQTIASFQHLPHDVAIFPPLDAINETGTSSPQLIGDRLRTLRKTRMRPPSLTVVTCVQALLQPTVAPDWIEKKSCTLKAGQEHDPLPLLPLLEESGYAFEPEVLSPGQASWRGGILDVWPPGSDWPLRIEFFGSTIESLRTFDPVEQKSREKLETIEIPPARETTGDSSPHSFIEYAGHDADWIWIDRENIEAHAELFESTRLDSATDGLTFDGYRQQIASSPEARQLVFTITPAPEDQAWLFDLQGVAGIPAAPGGAVPLDRVNEQRTKFLRDIFQQAANGWDVTIFFSNAGSRDRFNETHKKDIPAKASITLHEGILSESFRSVQNRRLFISDLDVYGMRREQATRYDRAAKRSRARTQTGERIHSWTDIQPGDYVVHIDHGIGIYRGLFEIDVQGKRQEALTIEYAEGAKIYVPVAQTHLLSRYIGVGKRRPELHVIGGKRWLREKASAEKAVEDMAAMLLETQATREARPGHAFSPDTTWQQEFESAFPYEETPDQARAIDEVKSDMESTKPMDRLVCGDVGYGKTEVAMRASFKAVMDGKQVAVLVPTTVLAQQHFDTFSERMAAFPVRIESLSRFQTKAEQADILARVADGAVDIVIGTHRLVQKDVLFRDLGLVIIDEEQRFGVKQKEQLKRLRQLVDVLTMTATPIPRTLYMSLTGAKDLSIIETAPVERLPIETIVTEHREDIVREAILRELNREGQVYFLHNRVGTIDHLHLKLSALVPEARIRVAHGQMNEHELSDVMRAFTRGDFDVLLCTTIIESGLNIPNVNTIIIDRADRFGLSELYQLRGRVGRYKRKAFAYLLLPKHGRLFFMARQRIGALKRYSSLGSGFKLAMRDLELRGAGNILGSEQSGHIASVGFDLYCQLLQRSVARMKGEKTEPVIEVDLDLDFLALSPDRADEAHAAVIPVHYIEDENIRVRMYRRIAALAREKHVEELARELRDRFGALPENVTRLLLIARIKIRAHSAQIRRIEVRGEKVIMTRRKELIMSQGKFPRLPPGEMGKRLEKLLTIIDEAGRTAPSPAQESARPRAKRINRH